MDRDQADLGVGGAAVFGEVGGLALGDCLGVAKDAGGSIEDDVLGGFGGAGGFEAEGGCEVGVAAGLGGGDDNAGRGRGLSDKGPGDPNVVSGRDGGEGWRVGFFAEHGLGPTVGGRGGDFDGVGRPAAGFNSEGFSAGLRLDDARGGDFTERGVGFH